MFLHFFIITTTNTGEKTPMRERRKLVNKLYVAAIITFVLPLRKGGIYTCRK